MGNFLTPASWQESLLTKILILTATRIEFNAVGRVLSRAGAVSRLSPAGLESDSKSSRIVLLQTGIGLERARAVTQHIVEHELWDVVISTGFAGALQCLPIGSLVVGNEVVLEHSVRSFPGPSQQRIICHPDLVEQSIKLQLRNSQLLQYGRFVTIDRVLTHATQKYLLGKQTGAVAVDMESGAIGQVAQQFNLPFLIVRAISDGVNEDLPVDFNLFLRPWGWIGGVRQVLSTAGCWKGFWRLYRNSRLASVQLSKFFENYLATLHLNAVHQP